MLSKDNITNFCHTTQYRSVWQTMAVHNPQAGACSFNSSGKWVSAYTEYEFTDFQQMGAIVFGMALKLHGSCISSFGGLILLISKISNTNSNRFPSEDLRQAKSIFRIKKCIVCEKWIDSFQGALFNIAFCFIGIKVMFQYDFSLSLIVLFVGSPSNSVKITKSYLYKILVFTKLRNYW